MLARQRARPRSARCPLPAARCPLPARCCMSLADQWVSLCARHSQPAPSPLRPAPRLNPAPVCATKRSKSGVFSACFQHQKEKIKKKTTRETREQEERGVDGGEHVGCGSPLRRGGAGSSAVAWCPACVEGARDARKLPSPPACPTRVCRVQHAAPRCGQPPDRAVPAAPVLWQRPLQTSCDDRDIGSNTFPRKVRVYDPNGRLSRHMNPDIDELVHKFESSLGLPPLMCVVARARADVRVAQCSACRSPRSGLAGLTCPRRATRPNPPGQRSGRSTSQLPRSSFRSKRSASPTMWARTNLSASSRARCVCLCEGPRREGAAACALVAHAAAWPAQQRCVCYKVVDDLGAQAPLPVTSCRLPVTARRCLALRRGPLRARKASRACILSETAERGCAYLRAGGGRVFALGAGAE